MNRVTGYNAVCVSVFKHSDGSEGRSFEPVYVTEEEQVLRAAGTWTHNNGTPAFHADWERSKMFNSTTIRREFKRGNISKIMRELMGGVR